LVLKKSNLVFGRDYRLVPTESPFFFPGQQFSVVIGKDEELGRLGVVHPRVLAKFGWGHPTAMWEIEVGVLERYYTASFQ
jgi:phenylalanyl-tRNA synthetase beta chain